MKLKTIDFDKLFSFFDLPSTPLIGVDITSSAVKMVELSKKRNGSIALENYASEPVPEGAFNDQGIANPEILGSAIEAAWKKLGSKIKTVAIALPTNAVITKRAHFSDQLEEAQVSDEVMIEANQYIPFPIEEVNVDWKIVGPYLAAPGDNEIVICAARKDRIEDYEAAAEAGGLKVAVVDVEIYAQQAAFSLLASGHPELTRQVVAVVDAGSSFVNINILQNETIIFSKDIPFGSQQLTESISLLYGISKPEAEAAKKDDGAGLEGYVENALRPFLDAFCMETNRAFQFFLTQATVEKIDAIVISGGCASLAGVAEAMTEICQINAIVANPFANMEHSSNLKGRNIEREAPVFMTACGLAMRRFDQ